MTTEKRKFETVDEYIDTFPKDVQMILEQIRSAAKQAVPEAEDAISYQLPALKYRGKNLLFYSAAKNHYAISVSPPFTVFEVFKDELSPHEVAKTSIKFAMDKPIPFDLLKKLIQYKAEELSKSTKKKP